MRFDFMCEENCEIEVYPLDGGSPLMTFTLPSIADAGALNLVYIQEKRFLQPAEYAVVSQYPAYWLVTPDDPPVQLGYFPLQTFTSPGGRWLVAATDEDGTGYRLWDLQTKDYVLEGGNTRALIAYFGESGIFVWETASEDKPASFYRFEDGAVFDLSEDFSYREVLPDGRLLAVVLPTRTDETGKTAGTYLYDPETGDAELLAAGMYPLPMRTSTPIQ
jgi:hypothetical protein